MPTDRRRTRLDRVIIDSRRVYYVFAGLITAFAVITFGLEWKNWGEQETFEQVQHSQLDRETLNEEEVFSELALARQLRDEERQVVRAALLRVDARVARIADDLDVMERKIAHWEDSTEELLKNDAGRVLAADATATRTYDALVKQDRPDPRVVDELRAPLDALRQTIDAAKSDETSTYRPSPEYLAELDGLEQEIKATTQVYDDHQRQLDLLVASAAQKGASKNAPTLGAALADQQRTWDQQRLAIIEAQLSEARQTGDQQIAAAQAEARRKADEATALKIEREAELEAQRLTQEREALARQQAEEKRLAELEAALEADMNDVRSLLAPFISEGYTQPRGRWFQDTTEKRPVSLSALRAEGALENSIASMQTLYYITGNGTNDRPLGGFPAYFGGFSDWREKQPLIRRAHELLNKHGEILVKKGMLSE